MMVNDFDVECVTGPPDEAEAPLVVDADAVLAGSSHAHQHFQVIAGRFRRSSSPGAAATMRILRLASCPMTFGQPLGTRGQPAKAC